MVSTPNVWIRGVVKWRDSSVVVGSAPSQGIQNVQVKISLHVSPFIP